jgi:hypothetical protein
MADHGRFPDRLDGMKQTCDEQRASQDFLKLRATLDLYAMRKVSADAVLPDRCDVEGGAP